MGIRLLLYIIYASAIQFGWAGIMDHPLFAVKKDVNENYVQYMAAVETNCTLRESDPIWQYWMIKDGISYRREELNGIEKHLYGIKIANQTSHRVEGTVRALDQKTDLPITITVERGQHGCHVNGTAGGKELPQILKLQQIELKKFSGTRPTELLILGKTPTGRRVQQTISLR